jgi:polar amino acid transport system substrate-binding protein
VKLGAMALPTKRKLIVSCLVAAILTLSSSTSFSDDKLTIITEDYAPFNYVENDELKGFAVAIVKSILARLKIKSEIKIFPWSRGYHFLQTKKNTVLFSTARTEIRESKFKWVGPIAVFEIGLYGVSHRSFKIKKLNDARGLLIGAERDGFAMQYLKARGFEKLDPSTKTIANLRKLLRGNNDLWFAGKEAVAANLKRLGKKSSAVKLVLDVGKTSLYIAFNKETSDDIVRLWQKTYDTLLKEGVIGDIVRSHNVESLSPASQSVN